MTTECTIRFKDPRTAGSMIKKVKSKVVAKSEAQTVGFVSGGIYFRTERHPLNIFAGLDIEGIEMSDIETIEFKMI